MKAKTTIQLDDFLIRSMDRNSMVNMGKNMVLGNRVCNHRSEGFGEQSGDGVIQDYPFSVVEDSDFIDSSVIKRPVL